MKGIGWKGSRFSPIAMGIGSHFVHIVQLKEKGDEISLAAAEAVPIKHGEDGVKSVVEAIRSVLAGGGYRGRRAVLCLKGDDIFIQHQRMALEGKRDVEGRIREEIRRHVPFDVDRAELRYITTGRVYERSELLDELILMIANREVTDRDLAILEELRLSAAMIGAEPLGQMRALLRFPPEGFSMTEVTGFMDIAASKSELLVIRNGGLAFTRSLPMGGEKFTEAISRKLGIDTESALRLKIALSNNQPVNDTLRSAALAAVRPVLEEICSEVLSCFRYFSSIFNRESVNRLIVVGQEIGGLANPAFMETHLHVPVLSWRPDVLQGGKRGPIHGGGLDFGYMPVIGTALEAMEPSPQRVDFMPREVVERLRRRTSMLLRAASLAFLLLVMFIFQLITEQRKEQLTRMRTYVQSQVDVIDQNNVWIAELDQKKQELKERRDLLLQTKPLIRPSRILAEVAKAAGKGITLKQFRLEKVVQIRRWEHPLKGSGPEKRRWISYLIHIRGLANNSDDVTYFVENLSATKAFSSINDEGFEDEVMQELNMKSFSLTLMVGGAAADEIF